MGLLCEWSWGLDKTKTEDCILPCKHRDKDAAVFARIVYKYQPDYPVKSLGITSWSSPECYQTLETITSKANKTVSKFTMKFTLPIISLLASTAMAAVGDLCVAQNVRRTSSTLPPPFRPVHRSPLCFPEKSEWLANGYKNNPSPNRASELVRLQPFAATGEAQHRSLELVPTTPVMSSAACTRGAAAPSAFACPPRTTVALGSVQRKLFEQTRAHVMCTL